MAENKILPWAQTPTANDLSDADYAADVATGGLYADGVKSGQASSKQANKTWRQATAPGSGLAQFIVDNLALDVTDSDTPAMFSSRIANAVLKLAQISPFNQVWATATGGYRKYAIVSDSSGNFWVSTADQNTTVPGSNGANWRSLFSGYATESWANTRFVKSGGGIGQDVGHNIFVGWGSYKLKVTVDAINLGNIALEDWANNTFVKNKGATQGGIIALDLDSDGSGRASFKRADGSWGILQPAGDYATNSALNTEITNRTNADTNLQNQMQAWADGRFQPAGDYATHSDLSGYLKNTNGGIGGEQSGTSLVYQTSARRAFFSYNNNRAGGNLAWYSDVTAEATARTNADNNLQSQISAKMDGSFAASGLFDGSQGSTTSGTIVGGTWMRVGNTLTQNLVIENIGGGTVTFPFAFSGNNNQVSVIVQDGTGSNNSYTTGSITTTGTGIHASGGGGTGRLHLTVSGPYGT